jgi:hypothetical protein
MNNHTALRVVPSRMSEADYDAKRTKLMTLYGDNNAAAAAKRDQALSTLFVDSGWTQEELSKEEYKSPQWIAQHLRFGRFLNYSTVVENTDPLPTNLTERRFRSFWAQTERPEGANNTEGEAERFPAVRTLITESAVLRNDKRPRIGAAIVKEFADGEWHHLKTIAAHVAEGDEDHVTSTMLNMLKEGGTNGGRAEKRKYGTSYQYRIFRTDERSIPIAEILTKLGPHLKRLIAQGKTNMATMSPGTVAECAALIERQLKEWSA